MSRNLRRRTTPRVFPGIGRVFALIVTLVAAARPAGALDSPQFRGPGRDGIFAETGLLPSWPAEGPALVWSAGGLGEGFASITVAGGRVYTTGKSGTEGTIFAFDLAGKKLWSKVYGKEHSGSGYPGTRTTPTVAGGRVFLLSSTAEAVALDAATGEELWKVDLVARFGAKNLYFGISESPLVLGELAIFTAGAPEAALVALKVADGTTVWTTKADGQTSAYCNPRLYEHGGKRQIVTLLEKSLVGVDPDNGALLWSHPYPVQYDIHAVSPLFLDDLIYVTDGYGQGGKAFRMAPDGRSVTQVWSDPNLDVNHGGAVLVDGVIYGAADKKTWYALDGRTGKVLASIPGLGKGSVVWADGKLYGYTEGGEVVLVDPKPASFAKISSFTIQQGDGHHWAHPVIANGILYIRHGDVLMAFDVQQKAASS